MPGKTKTFYERFSYWTRNSIMLRVISIAILVLLLLIPTAMIEDLIRERQNYRQQAIQEVSSSWAGAQTLAGPVLTVPYRSVFRNSEGQLSETTEYAHFLPERLNIAVKLQPEIRYRGLYEAVVYNASLRFEGKFDSPDFADLNIDTENVQWQDAFVAVGIPDMRGIEQQVVLDWAGKSQAFDPGVGTQEVLASGISVDVPLDSASRQIPFTFALDLNGSSSLGFLPMGKITQVNVHSPWTTPSFSGAFLPDTRKVTEEGFVAGWEVLHLNRNFPQAWKGNQYYFPLNELASAEETLYPPYRAEPELRTGQQNYTFGVNLLMPVDQYRKSMRSAKYAIMFISLTFLTFFFVEILNRRRIHPIQYLLVGLALCIFFALLLAISEHTSFNLAYILSAFAVTALIAIYISAMFKSIKLTAMLSLLLVLMYGFIFTLLQLEDYALLIGSIALFIILAVVMYISRRIDWYAVADPEEEEIQGV
ncbi:MAG: cell envelope integrity protein CreD [Cyclobacteriaceae bacterium]